MIFEHMGTLGRPRKRVYRDILGRSEEQRYDHVRVFTIGDANVGSLQLYDVLLNGDDEQASWYDRE